MAAIRVLEYLDKSGAIAAAVAGVGSGVFEAKIDFGPGYRIYFGKDGETVVILLGGSTKKRQSAAIASAHKAWDDYKRRKKGAA